MDQYNSNMKTEGRELDYLVSIPGPEGSIHPPDIHGTKDAKFENGLPLKIPIFQTGSRDGK